MSAVLHFWIFYSEKFDDRHKMTKNEFLNTTSLTKFEHFPHELILMCFTYLDFYNIYEIFFCLNKRFNQLIQYQTKLHIDLSSIPHRKFLTFCFNLKQLIPTSQNYPLSILAHDKHKLSLILEDDLFTETFSKLKSLTLSNMDSTTIYSMIFDSTTNLYQSLERLSLVDEIIEEDDDGLNHIRDHLCSNLISAKMKLLKYLKLNFRPYRCECGLYTCSDYVYLEFNQLIVEDTSLSNLETLIIGDSGYRTDIKLWFNTLSEKLLPRLPKLKNLLINSIHFDEDYYPGRNRILPSTTEMNPNISLNLQSIKIWAFESIDSYGDVETIERFLRDFFMNNNSTDKTTIKLFRINRKNVFEIGL